MAPLSGVLSALTAGRNAAPQAWATAGFFARRAFGASAGTPVTLGADGLLVQTAERAWGASAVLPASLGAPGKATIGVLREPFAAFDQPATPLSKIIASLGGNNIAVSTAVLAPHTKVVVDEYVSTPAGYKLAGMATDLLSYLHRHGASIALVPDVATASATTAAAGLSLGIRQSSNEVLMVSPTAFGFNEQAAQDNAFMRDVATPLPDNSFMNVAAKPGEGGGTLTREVLSEFAGLYRQLADVHGVNVSLFEHGLQHGTPDACFPNNWFSTHAAGEAAGGNKESTLVLYPMKCPNRAAERRADTIEVLKARGYGRVYDMSIAEADNKYFEGTDLNNLNLMALGAGMAAIAADAAAAAGGAGAGEESMEGVMVVAGTPSPRACLLTPGRGTRGATNAEVPSSAMSSPVRAPADHDEMHMGIPPPDPSAAMHRGMRELLREEFAEQRDLIREEFSRGMAALAAQVTETEARVSGVIAVVATLDARITSKFAQADVAFGPLLRLVPELSVAKDGVADLDARMGRMEKHEVLALAQFHVDQGKSREMAAKVAALTEQVQALEAAARGGEAAGRQVPVAARAPVTVAQPVPAAQQQLPGPPQPPGPPPLPAAVSGRGLTFAVVVRECVSDARHALARGTERALTTLLGPHHVTVVQARVMFANNHKSKVVFTVANEGHAAFIRARMLLPRCTANMRRPGCAILPHLPYAEHQSQRRMAMRGGVLVIDRINGVAYVNISERAHPDLARQWVDTLGYQDLVTFRASDLRGKPVYHTNVMMAIGTGVAIVCGESVRDEKERKRLMGALAKTHEVVDISLTQMDSLCGNALEVQSRDGVPVMAMSTQAYNAFTADQLRAIRRHVADIAHAPVDMLEKVGGGGVRCTLAELF
ncbi:hypothetical protein FOA52_013708 [Chlamydomonas sp. UWO 241]|nr:hypothetical protein FOA52_013708 [Chlamydomonas sp. UWO 241]